MDFIKICFLSIQCRGLIPRTHAESAVQVALKTLSQTQRYHCSVELDLALSLYRWARLSGLITQLSLTQWYHYTVELDSTISLHYWARLSGIILTLSLTQWYHFPLSYTQRYHYTIELDCVRLMIIRLVLSILDYQLSIYLDKIVLVFG